MHIHPGHLWTNRHARSRAINQGTTSPRASPDIRKQKPILPTPLCPHFLDYGLVFLQYDRSGRSSGTAFIAFETNAEATRAKKQFDGILAKGNVFSFSLPPMLLGKKLTCFCLPLGQPMEIVFDTLPPRNPRRSASVPSTSSLLNRIQKPPLVDRLSRDDSSIKAPSGPYVSSRS